jgi:hypothetical protein
MELIPVFKGDTLGGSGLRARLNLSSDEGGYGQDLPNLAIVNLELINKGNRDLPTFSFGATLAPGDVCAHCDMQSSDRHHKTNLLTAIGPGSPTVELDFVLSPFNRGDVYTFKLYIIVVDGKDSPGELKLSSTEPIIFKALLNLPEVALEAASSISIGPFRIGLGPKS